MEMPYADSTTWTWKEKLLGRFMHAGGKGADAALRFFMAVFRVLKSARATKFLPISSETFLSISSEYASPKIVFSQSNILSSTWWVGALTGIGWNYYLVQIGTMLINLTWSLAGKYPRILEDEGYNMGAGKTLRVRDLFTRLLVAEALVGAVALVLAEGFPRQLITIFGAANESSYYTAFAVKAFRQGLLFLPAFSASAS